MREERDEPGDTDRGADHVPRVRSASLHVLGGGNDRRERHHRGPRQKSGGERPERGTAGGLLREQRGRGEGRRPGQRIGHVLPDVEHYLARTRRVRFRRERSDPQDVATVGRSTGRGEAVPRHQEAVGYRPPVQFLQR